MDPHSIDTLDPGFEILGGIWIRHKKWLDVRLTGNEVSSVLWAVL
jgi:hypothetical protein